jgi:histidinol-phosphate/aromatic aminotransferase/cobyric acid decarboxylase-like protein/choline kinase
MQAIILAAGLGRRMHPLSKHCHKSLLPIAGRPLLGRMFDALIANGILDILIVTGYRRDEVMAYVDANYPQARVRWVHNAEYDRTNNIRSLALAFEALPEDSDIVLIECDLIFEASVLELLLRSPHADVALVDRFRAGMDGTVVAVENGLITQVIPPHLQSANFDYSDKYKTLNIYRFSREFCSRIFRRLVSYYAHSVDDNCYYELVLGILIYMHHAKVHAEILDGERWTEIDDPLDLSVAEFEFNPARRREILEQSHGGYWKYGITDFAYIRNAHFPTPDILSDLKNHLPELLGQYGSAQRLLDERLAYLLDCQAEQVVVLNGLSQAFPWLSRHCGERVLIPAPTFGEYPRAFPQADTYADAPGLDSEALETRLGRYDTVVLVNPNNPTGTVLPVAQIQGWLREYPKTRFLVDESFVDFCGEPSLLDINAPPNLVLLKSLSKPLGVPGLRLGWLFSTDTTLVAGLRASLPVWNLNSLAEYFLESLFKHRRELAESFERTRADRAALAENLRTLDGVLNIYPSGANFLLVRLCPQRFPAEPTVRALLNGPRLFVKEISSRFPGGDTWLRLGLRLPDENRRLIEALREAGQIG